MQFGTVKGGLIFEGRFSTGFPVCHGGPIINNKHCSTQNNFDSRDISNHWSIMNTTYLASRIVLSGIAHGVSNSESPKFDLPNHCIVSNGHSRVL